jgi:hypothetical protein
MSNNAVVKKDQYGIYVIGGGWILRPHPKCPSIFQEGDLVKAHHFGGTPQAGVTLRHKSLTFKGLCAGAWGNENCPYEMWSTQNSAWPPDLLTPEAPDFAHITMRNPWLGGHQKFIAPYLQALKNAPDEAEFQKILADLKRQKPDIAAGLHF